MANNLRFLIVDDDPISQQKLNAILSQVGECEVAASGNAGVGVFIRNFNDNTPFDFVALDIGLPDVKGTEVLARIRQFEDANAGLGRRAKIIMITSHSKREIVRMAVKNGCNGYIVKPFSETGIYDKLAELGFIDGLETFDEGGGQLQPVNSKVAAKPKTTASSNQPNAVAASAKPAKQSLKDTIIGKIKEIKSGTFTLPGQPDVYLKLKALIDEGADLVEIAELLKNHSTITGALIRISNSARYRGSKPNNSISEAVGRLGLRDTLEQVCAISTKEMSSDMPEKYLAYAEKIWKGSLGSAFACEKINATFKPNISVDPFTMGLMHDIGKMAMLKIFQHIEETKVYPGEITWDAMTPIMDKYEGALGALLLQKWSLSEAYQKVARYHGGQAPNNEFAQEMSMANLSRDIVSVLDDLDEEVEESSEQITELVKKNGKHYSELSAAVFLDIARQVSGALQDSLNAID